MKLKKIFFLFCLIIISCESDKFTTANGNVLEVSSLVGMNVLDIAYELNESNSETLIGTNNERWVVYFNVIDVTVESNKSTDIVQKARKGKKPKKVLGLISLSFLGTNVPP